MADLIGPMSNAVLAQMVIYTFGINVMCLMVNVLVTFTSLSRLESTLSHKEAELYHKIQTSDNPEK